MHNSDGNNGRSVAINNCNRVIKFVILAAFLGFFGCFSYAKDGSREDYKLGAGDKIRISVYDEDDLTVEAVLTDSGVINYPFLGPIQVVGKTLSEVEHLIFSGLENRYILRPNVNVSILEYRNFFVIGEVKEPGGYAFQPGLTVSKAVALANGFTERASKRKVFVLRNQGSESVRFKAELNWKISPGDVISVEQSFF